jgi:hypothetical protein
MITSAVSKSSLTTSDNIWQQLKGAVALSHCRAVLRELIIPTHEHALTRTTARISLERSNAPLYGCQHRRVLRAELVGELWGDSSVAPKFSIYAGHLRRSRRFLCVHGAFPWLSPPQMDSRHCCCNRRSGVALRRDMVLVSDYASVCLSRATPTLRPDAANDHHYVLRSHDVARTAIKRHL